METEKELLPTLFYSPDPCLESCTTSVTEENRKWQLTPVFLPGKSYGHKSLVSYNRWGPEESGTTGRLHHRHHQWRLRLWTLPPPVPTSKITSRSISKSSMQTFSLVLEGQDSRLSSEKHPAPLWKVSIQGAEKQGSSLHSAEIFEIIRIGRSKTKLFFFSGKSPNYKNRWTFLYRTNIQRSLRSRTAFAHSISWSSVMFILVLYHTWLYHNLACWVLSQPGSSFCPNISPWGLKTQGCLLDPHLSSSSASSCREMSPLHSNHYFQRNCLLQSLLPDCFPSLWERPPLNIKSTMLQVLPKEVSCALCHKNIHGG